MSETERRPCLHCAESASVEARLCPHCRASLLVDVVAETPLPDRRDQYQAARALAALGPPAPAFSEVQSALASPDLVLMRQATRGFADRAIAAVAAHGVKAREAVAPHAPARAGALLPWRVLAVTGVVVLLVIAVFVMRRGGATSHPEAPAPALGARAITAAAPGARAIIDAVLGSTVSIRCAQSVGSGFVVGEGLVMTNAHVVCPSSDTMTVALASGKQLAGTLVRKNDWLDAALVAVEGAEAKPLPLGDASALREGDRLVMVGSPKGLEFTVQEGIVSHNGRAVMGLTYVQIGIHINPGNSGGPVVDDHGRVVGIASMALEASSGLGLALPVNYAYESFDGEPAFLPPSAEPYDVPRWKRMRAQAEDEDRQDVEREAGGPARPGLLRAGFVPGRGFVALVGRFASSAPSSESFSFSLEADGQGLCAPRGQVESWEKLKRKAESADSRYFRWLERNGLLKDLFGGLVPLSLDGCPAPQELLSRMAGGLTLILDGADERATRAPVAVILPGM